MVLFMSYNISVKLRTRKKSSDNMLQYATDYIHMYGNYLVFMVVIFYFYYSLFLLRPSLKHYTYLLCKCDVTAS